MALLKYATFAGDVVDTITFYPDRDADGNVLAGQELVPDDVFAGFIRGENGSFSPPTQATTPPVVDDVIAERERRLALGFDYDFGDGRGIHRIGTTADDMRKWMDEVTPFAQAFINSSQPSGEIEITTETGKVIVSAAEWQMILLAAGSYRQPIYSASFDLQAMDPIPADYADDSRWP